MDPKTRGIVAYLTIIGWVIALVTNNPKDEQTSFHLRQMLGLMLLGFASSFILWIPIIGWVAWLGVLILWIIGLLSALEGSRKAVPFIGEQFQEWFKSL